MAVLLQVPLDSADDSTTLLVEAERADMPRELTLAAAPEPGKAAARAAHSLADSLDALHPMLRTIKDKLAAAGPSEFTVCFGVKLGGETGLIVAKGSAEVNFTVTMSWQQQNPSGAE